MVSAMILILFRIVCKYFFESCEMFKLNITAKRWKNTILYAKYLFNRVQDAMVLRSAAALSYTTLLAVIPLLAVALSVFTAFPSYISVRAQVQDFLIQYLMPDVVQNIQNYTLEFIGAVGKLTTMGIIGLAVTAILMLSTIEDSFNFIFKVKRQRKIIKKIYLYGFLIVVCPLLLGTALSLKGYLLTLKYFHPEHIYGYTAISTYILPNILTLGFLFCAYVQVPNKKVQKRYAFWGALSALIMMLILRQGFGYFMDINVTYRTIYGAMAAFPILLVWMYLWWTVVLSGAIITSSLGEYKSRK